MPFQREDPTVPVLRYMVGSRTGTFRPEGGGRYSRSTRASGSGGFGSPAGAFGGAGGGGFAYETYEGEWGPRPSSIGRTSLNYTGRTGVTRGGRSDAGSTERDSAGSPSQRENRGAVYTAEFGQYQHSHKWVQHFASSLIAGI